MLLAAVCLISFICTCTGTPINTKYKHRTTREKPVDIDDYLGKYGYLPPVDSSSGNNPTHSEQHRKYAIRLFQKFAHLRSTGRINKQTVAKMKQPRCGFPDIINTNHDPSEPLKYTTGKKWKNQTVTWRIVAYTDKLTVNQQRNAIENSFRRWQNSSDLSFVETHDKANIDILFDSGNHGDGLRNAFDGAGGVLAHAFLPEDGRAHFDNDEYWVFHQSEGPEIEMVATHELGHSLGLSHSTVRGAVMAPFYRQYIDNFALHADDIAGIQYLYGPPEVATTASATAKPEVSDTTVTSQQKTVTITQVPQPGVVVTTAKASSEQPSIQSRQIGSRLCSSNIDAAIPGADGIIQLFIGPYIYKLYENCDDAQPCVVKGYPRPIKDVFRRGPRRVTAAAFLPDRRQRTYLFKGRKIWRYTRNQLDSGYPKQMDKEDMPYKPHAAYIQNNQFSDYQWYIFGGKYFWELNLHSETISNGSMKIKTYWNHVPAKPDAMMQTKAGTIYVFKGKYYNTFDHRRMLLEKKRVVARDLLGIECS